MKKHWHWLQQFNNLISRFSFFSRDGIKQSLRISLGFVFFGCTNIFFQPDRFSYSTPEKFNLKYQSFYFDSKDGTKLHAWKVHRKEKFKQSSGTIILFHGNAQNLSSHWLNLAWMTEFGYDLMIFDYRGYGQSEGVAHQKGIHEDSIKALEVAYDWSKENKSFFIAYGQSLGGAIMARAIADFKQATEIKLIVLDSTFLSYQKIALKKLFDSCLFSLFSPLAFILVNDDYAPENILDKLPGTNYLVMHAPMDPIVPYSLGKKVFKKLKSEKKTFWEIKAGFHTDAFFVDDYKYRKEFLEFLEKLK